MPANGRWDLIRRLKVKVVDLLDFYVALVCNIYLRFGTDRLSQNVGNQLATNTT